MNGLVAAPAQAKIAGTDTGEDLGKVRLPQTPAAAPVVGPRTLEADPNSLAGAALVPVQSACAVRAEPKKSED